MRSNHILDFKILFVCKGNICRSPAAEALLKTLLPKHTIDSCAYTDETKNQYIDPAMAAALITRSIDVDLFRQTKYIEDMNLDDWNLIIALDTEVGQAMVGQPKMLVWDIEDPYGTDKHTECVIELEHKLSEFIIALN